LGSVVDYRGQAVSALGKIHVSNGLPILLIWGEQDRIIYVAPGYAAYDAHLGLREPAPAAGWRRRWHCCRVTAPT
jgi:hypothetical protein